MNVKLCWNHFSKIDVAALQMTFIQEDLNKFYRNREIFDVDFMKTNIWFESRVARPAELPVVHSDVVLQVQCLFIVYLKFEFNTLMFSSFAHGFFFVFSRAPVDWQSNLREGTQSVPLCWRTISCQQQGFTCACCWNQTVLFVSPLIRGLCPLQGFISHVQYLIFTKYLYCQMFPQLIWCHLK